MANVMDHPAILKAQEIYDSERDELLPHETALISAVNKARNHRTNVYVASNVLYGNSPRQMRANEIIADQTCIMMLTRALDIYNAELEAAS